MGTETWEIVIKHICGNSGALSCGYADHRCLTVHGFAKLVQEVFLHCKIVSRIRIEDQDRHTFARRGQGCGGRERVCRGYCSEGI